jgi:hypothetical protein
VRPPVALDHNATHARHRDSATVKGESRHLPRSRHGVAQQPLYPTGLRVNDALEIHKRTDTHGLER